MRLQRQPRRQFPQRTDNFIKSFFIKIWIGEVFSSIEFFIIIQ